MRQVWVWACGWSNLSSRHVFNTSIEGPTVPAMFHDLRTGVIITVRGADTLEAY